MSRRQQIDDSVPTGAAPSVPYDDWDRHWDEYAESAAANPAQHYRRRLILSLLGPLVVHSRVLDIGSGQGDLASELQRMNPSAEILGLELSESGVETSRRKVPSARFVQRDLLQPLDVPEGQKEWATHAVCSEVLEHVDHPETLLRHALRYLAPGSQLVITVPGGPMSAYDRHIGHRRHYSPGDLRRLLEATGLEVETCTGAGFPFFNVYRVLVILRGRQLVKDVSSARPGASSLPARLVMAAFHRLFRLNLHATPLGWQVIAKARLPLGPAR